MALCVQHRRHVVGIEHDLVVGLAFDHTGDADRRKTVAGIALEHQAQVEPADLERGVAVDRGVAVAHADLGHRIARPHRTGGLLGVGLDHAGARQHQRENHLFVAGVSGDVECGRRSVVAGNRKRGAVGQNAVSRIEAELAEGKRRLVERQRDEAPAITQPCRQTLPQLVFEVAVVLLEMLGLEEHALRPNHLVVPGHSLLSCGILALRVASGWSAPRSFWVDDGWSRPPLAPCSPARKTLAHCTSPGLDSGGFRVRAAHAETPARPPPPWDIRVRRRPQTPPIQARRGLSM